MALQSWPQVGGEQNRKKEDLHARCLWPSQEFSEVDVMNPIFTNEETKVSHSSSVAIQAQAQWPSSPRHCLPGTVLTDDLSFIQFFLS